MGVVLIKLDSMGVGKSAFSVCSGTVKLENSSSPDCSIKVEYGGRLLDTAWRN